MPNNIYPDLSNDKFDVKYAKRKIISSDLLSATASYNKPRVTAGIGGYLGGSNEPEIPPIEDYPPGGSGGCGVSASDLELTVLESGVPTNQIIAGNSTVTLTSYKNHGLRVFRNWVLLSQTEYTWDNQTMELVLDVNPEIGEVFYFMPYLVCIPAWTDTEYIASVGGGTENNFQIDSSIINLTTFIGAKIRLFRNNILQSPISDFSWDTVSGDLTLTIPVQQDEKFTVMPY